MSLQHLGGTLRERLEAGQGSRLVTVLATSGPAYVPPGAMVLLAAPGERPHDDAALAGYLSGGCLEEEVAARSVSVGSHVPVMRLRLDTGDDGPFGLGLACGGELDLLVEWLPPEGKDAPSWHAWASAIAGREPAVRWLTPGGTAAWQTEREGRRVAATHRTGDVRVLAAETPNLLHRRPPEVVAHLVARRGGWQQEIPRPPKLRIIGAEREAEVLSGILARQGWEVEVHAPSRAKLQRLETRVRERDGCAVRTILADARAIAELRGCPDDRILGASHRLDLDAAAAEAAVRTGARWFGAIGSHKRARALHAQLRASVGASMVSASPAGHHRTQIEIPAGIDVGARGPEEIATAIAARLTQDLREMARPVYAIVPAAGASRRMGIPKMLLHDGHETLLARAQRLALTVADGVLVVTGAHHELVAAELDEDVKQVQAGDGRGGLGASLLAGLRGAPRGARILVVLPDMPGVDAQHLHDLVAAGRSSGGAASAYPDGRIGAPAVLPPDLVEALRNNEERLASGEDRGFQRWLEEREDLAVVALHDARDLDAPRDLTGTAWHMPSPEAMMQGGNPERRLD